MNGKGDKPRPVDRAKYESHSDRIFRRNETMPRKKLLEKPGDADFVAAVHRMANGRKPYPDEIAAIRADERAKIVAWLRDEAEAMQCGHRCGECYADAIEKGEHEAPA